MTKNPLVSIITVTYNHESYIGQCIDSVINQTYPNWEQIIIDDGSTDLTAKIISQYTTDKRISYFRQEHEGILGLGRAYNRALKLARGELIAILEGDDFWPLDKLEKQIPAFANAEVILSWGRGVYVNEEGKEIKKSKAPKYTMVDGKDAFKRLLLRNFVIPTVTVMVRKEALMPDGFRQPEGVPYVDYPTWLEIARLGKFVFVDEILGFWRLHKRQMSRNIWQMRKGDILTYFYLWRREHISFPVFMCLVLWSLAKHTFHMLTSRSYDVSLL